MAQRSIASHASSPAHVIKRQLARSGRRDNVLQHRRAPACSHLCKARLCRSHDVNISFARRHINRSHDVNMSSEFEIAHVSTIGGSLYCSQPIEGKTTARYGGRGTPSKVLELAKCRRDSGSYFAAVYAPSPVVCFHPLRIRVDVVHEHVAASSRVRRHHLASHCVVHRNDVCRHCWRARSLRVGGTFDVVMASSKLRTVVSINTVSCAC